MDLDKENPSKIGTLDGEILRGADDAAGLPGKLLRYSQARHRALEMFKYTTEHGHAKEAQKLGSCGEYLVFRHYFAVDKMRLHGAQFCKRHLLCPLCAIRRGAKALKAYLDRFEVIQSEYSNLRPFLVTFTVKNGDDLDERFQHLRHGLQRLHRMRTRSRQVSEVRKAAGAVWSYEVTNRGKGWHPHAHAIWLCHDALDPDKLSEQWHELTGDSFIVDVRPIAGDPVQGFLEVFKYALKFSDLELADNFTAYETLRGERLVASFGCFRGVEIPESLLDEPLEDLAFSELFYRFITGVGYDLDLSKSHIASSSL